VRLKLVSEVHNLIYCDSFNVNDNIFFHKETTVKYKTKSELYNENKKKCVVFINEVMPTYHTEDGPVLRHYQFIELTKRCGPAATKPVHNKLDGYLLLIVDFGTFIHPTLKQRLPVVTFALDLAGEELYEDKTSSSPTYYFTIGSVFRSNTTFDFPLSNPAVKSTSKKNLLLTNVIPHEHDSPIVVTLLKYENLNQKGEIESLKPTLSLDGSYAHVLADCPKINIIKNWFLKTNL